MLRPRVRPLASALRSLLTTPTPTLTPTTPSLALRAYATAAPDVRNPSKKSATDKPAKRSRRDPDPPTGPAAAAAALKDIDLSTILRSYKPRTPGVRHLRRPINDHLWKGKPHRILTFAKKGQALGGRNNTGHITVRHRGGGHKRRIRTVDFERREPGPHLVERIEYDPGRTAHIALLTRRETGKKSYIVAADGMRAGDVVHSYRAGIPQELIDDMGGVIDPGVLASRTALRGNCLPMHMIPVATMIYCISANAEGPAIFCRSAGTYGVITSKEEEEAADGSKVLVGQFVQVRLQSGEIRKVDKNSIGTIGVASNVHYHYTSLGKAGRARWLGRRPTVRGLAMNSGMYSSRRGGNRFYLVVAQANTYS